MQTALIWKILLILARFIRTPNQNSLDSSWMVWWLCDCDYRIGNFGVLHAKDVVGSHHPWRNISSRSFLFTKPATFGDYFLDDGERRFSDPSHWIHGLLRGGPHQCQQILCARRILLERTGRMLFTRKLELGDYVLSIRCCSILTQKILLHFVRIASRQSWSRTCWILHLEETPRKK